MESHLLQMRGLKHESTCQLRLYYQVASFTDAWIETVYNTTEKAIKVSHLLQMRGLKLQQFFNLKHLSSRIFYRCVD